MQVVGGEEAGTPADIAAHSRLDREVSGLNYPRTCSARFHVHMVTLLTFFIFEGPKGRYGPREAWAHMGWVGHPAH